MASSKRRLLFRVYVYLPILIAVLYVVGGVILYFAQDSMIFPGHAMQGRPEAQFQPPAGSEIVQLSPGGGVNVVALFSPSTSSESRTAPTIVFFYGNATVLADTLDEVRRMNAVGANVLVVEYPGYGVSTGKPSEAAFNATVEAVWDHLAHRRDVDLRRIVPLGWSLGSGPATEMATRHPVAALVLAAPFTSMRDMARRQAPIYPTSLLLRSAFDNQTKLRDLACPILIFHGRRDTMIPFTMSERLHEANLAHVKLVISELGGHDDVFVSDDGLLIKHLAELIRSIAAQQ